MMKVRNLSSSVLEVLGLIIGYFYFIAFVVLAAVSGGVLFTKVYTNPFVSLIPFVLCSFCVSVCYVSYEFIAGIKTRDRERLLPFIDVAIVCFIALVFAAVIYGFHGVPVHLYYSDVTFVVSYTQLVRLFVVGIVINIAILVLICLLFRQFKNHHIFQPIQRV